MLKIVSARTYAEGEEKMGNMTRAIHDLYIENEKLKKELKELYLVSKDTIEKAVAREQEALTQSRQSEEIMKRALEFMMAHAMEGFPN